MRESYDVTAARANAKRAACALAVPRRELAARRRAQATVWAAGGRNERPFSLSVTSGKQLT
jgi:hypothetical protein